MVFRVIIFSIFTLVFCNAVSSEMVHIIFIRHGEAKHNVMIRKGMNEEGRALHDPRLTAAGRKQARKLAAKMSTRNVDLVIASPMKRTLQTALLIFPKRNVPIIVNQDLAEHKCAQCNLGSKADVLENEFPQFDFSSLTKKWNHLESSYQFQMRVDDFNKVVSDKKVKAIAIVSHAGYIKRLTGHKLKNCEVYETDWEI